MATLSVLSFRPAAVVSPVSFTKGANARGTAAMGGMTAPRRGIMAFGGLSGNYAARVPSASLGQGRLVTASAGGAGEGESVRAPPRPKGARARRQWQRRRERPPAPLRCAEPTGVSTTVTTTTEREDAAEGASGGVGGAAVDGVVEGEEKKAAPADGGVVKKEKSKNSDESSDNAMGAREFGTVGLFVALLGSAVAAAGGPDGAGKEIVRAFDLLLENHLPGAGGVIEDSFLGLLTVCTVYSLWRSSVIPRPVGNPIKRKSRTNASWLHVISGAGALAMGLYAVVLERVYRESPGWTWMWVSSALFLTNALTYGPLMQIFKASKEGKYAMKLGYSFVASFQGVVFIAWSAQPDAPDWMYWAVMPFWYFSIAKLWESTEFVLALAPKSEPGSFMETITAGSKRRLGKMTPDAATLTYVSLNAFAAVFDNCYMALYTALGPEQFWHTSQMFNDADFHLRLVKGTTGSLTVALLIFISTLGWRRQMSMDLAIWLNVILGSVGPWIVLFWHKLEDPSEDWFPQFVFDPAFDYHPLWQTASHAAAVTTQIQ